MSGRLSVPGQALFHQDSSLHCGLSHTWEKKLPVNAPFLTSKGRGDIHSGSTQCSVAQYSRVCLLET